MLSVYNSMGSSVTLACARAVLDTPVAGPSRTAEDKTQDYQDCNQVKEQGAEDGLGLP